LECSSPVCSVALSVDGKTMLTLKGERQNSHAEVITLLIEQLMQETSTSLDSLDAICHSNGPGSYTGLRVGASTAKGLAFGLQIPVICISTLKGLAAAALKKLPEMSETELICPMIDARRMEVYTALFDKKLNDVLSPQASIVDVAFQAEQLSAQNIWFCGDGMPKSKLVLSAQHNACFLENIKSKAENFSEQAYFSFQKKDFANTAYFEPFYLKNYEAKLPKKML